MAELICISVGSTAAGASRNIGSDVSEFLEALCNETLDGRQITALDKPTGLAAEVPGVGQTGALGDMNFPDWQSLMLPNDFLFSEVDLMQSFGR